MSIRAEIDKLRKTLVEQGREETPPKKDYTTHIETLKGNPTLQDIETIQEDTTNIDEEIANKVPLALKLNKAVDSFNKKHNISTVATDSIEAMADLLGVEIHSLKDGSKVIYKDSVEILKGCDDDVLDYFDDMSEQLEVLRGNNSQ